MIEGKAKDEGCSASSLQPKDEEEGVSGFHKTAQARLYAHTRSHHLNGYQTNDKRQLLDLPDHCIEQSLQQALSSLADPYKRQRACLLAYALVCKRFKLATDAIQRTQVAIRMRSSNPRRHPKVKQLLEDNDAASQVRVLVLEALKVKWKGDKRYTPPIQQEPLEVWPELLTRLTNVDCLCLTVPGHPTIAIAVYQRVGSTVELRICPDGFPSRPSFGRKPQRGYKVDRQMTAVGLIAGSLLSGTICNPLMLPFVYKTEEMRMALQKRKATTLRASERVETVQMRMGLAS